MIIKTADITVKSKDKLVNKKMEINLTLKVQRRVFDNLVYIMIFV